MPGRWLSDTHVGLAARPGSLRGRRADARRGLQLRLVQAEQDVRQAGVTCSDCHEPHSAKLRASGDGVCLQCHAPEKYAVAAHSRHEGVSSAARLRRRATCRRAPTWWSIRRHDHSFRIPRPDLSAKLGTPNACNACHADKIGAMGGRTPSSAGMAPTARASRTTRRPSMPPGPDQADAADAACGGSGRPRHAGLRPRRRARRARVPSFAGEHRSRAQRASPIPIRWSASARSTCWTAFRRAQLWPMASPLLADPVRGVRISARRPPCGRSAREPARAPTAQRFDRAAAEFVAAQQLNADRPEGRATLGNFLARRGAQAWRRRSTRPR